MDNEPDYYFSKRLVAILRFLITEIEKHQIDPSYDSGKIRGKIYHAGSSGDAFLQGRNSALIVFRKLMDELEQKIKEHEQKNGETK